MPSWKKIIVSGSDAQLNSVNVGTGTYDTGLFDTYTSATTVGTAIGDFNNILKALAPAQAPAYSTLGATGSVGQASSVSPTFVGVGGLTYISKPYLSGSGIIANNTTFQKYSDTSNRNYLGAISASRAFSSFRITTNPATTANASTYTNYPNGAFFAQLGTTEETWTLKLNGSQLDSFTVRDANASSSINANFGTFTVGPYKSAEFITTGDDVTNYGSRSGSFTFTIPATEANLAWNPGLNNFEVTRSVGGTEYKSNTYWLWDPGVNVLITETSVKLLSGSNTDVYGGIEYLTTAPTLQVTASVDNFYKYSWTAGNVASVALTGLAPQTVSTLTSPTYDAVTEVSRSFTLNKSSRYLPTDSYRPVLTSSPALRSSQTLTFSAPSNVVLYDGLAASSTLVTKRVRKDVGTSGPYVAVTNGLVTPGVVYQNAYSAWSNDIVTNAEGVYYNGLIYGAKSSTLDTLWSRITAGTISPSNSSVSTQISTWEAQSTFNFGFYVNRSAVNASDNIPLIITTPSGLGSGTVTVDLYYQTTGGGTVYNDTFSTTLATLRSGTTFTFQGGRSVQNGNDVVVVIKNIPSGANIYSYISAIAAGTGWTI